MNTTTLTRQPMERAQLSSRATILALARVEALRLVRHPAFVVGLATSLAMCILRSGEDAWAGQSYYLVGVAWAFAWSGTLVAAALVAGRERMRGDPALFPATPVLPGDRVVAAVLALAGPTAVVAVAVAMVAVLKAQSGGFAIGEEPFARAIVPPLAEWAQPVVLAALAGVVGIAVAQLNRGRLAALLFLGFATYITGTSIWMFQAHPFRVLHPFMFPSYESELPASFTADGWRATDPPLLPPDEWTSAWRTVHFDTAALTWHLLYVAGLVVVGVWWARRAADRGERRQAGWLLLAGVHLLLVGGVAQLLTAGVNPGLPGV